MNICSLLKKIAYDGFMAADSCCDQRTAVMAYSRGIDLGSSPHKLFDYLDLSGESCELQRSAEMASDLVDVTALLQHRVEAVHVLATDGGLQRTVELGISSDTQ